MNHLNSSMLRFSRISSLMGRIRRLLRHTVARETIIVWAVFFIVYGFITLRVYAGGLLDLIPSYEGSHFGYDTFYNTCWPSYIVLGKHPLLWLFFNLPFHGLQYLVGYETACALLLILTTLLASGSIALTYHYIRRFVRLNIVPSLIFSGLLATAFTPIILSFTLDTYSPSFFFLVLALNIQTYCLQAARYKATEIRQSYLPAIIAGGITMSNLFKPLGLLLVDRCPFRYRVKRIVNSLFIIGIVFTLFFAIPYGLSKMYIKHRMQTEEFIPPDYSGRIKVSAVKGSDLTVMGFITQDEHRMQRFFFHPFMRPPVNLIPSPHYNPEYGYPNHPVTDVTPPYAETWKLIYGCALFGLAIIAAAIAYRRRELWLILLYFSVDFFVHIIMGFGANEGDLYAGHWIFVVPLGLAWGYKELLSSEGYHKLRLGARVLFITSISIAIVIQISTNLPNIATLILDP